MLLHKSVLNFCYYSGLELLLRPILSGMGSILMLHHVRNMPKGEFSPNYHLSASPEFLDELIEALSSSYDFISMDDVAERLKAANTHGFDTSKKPFLAITLDDGYKDNLEYAVPVFRKHNVPYMLYVAPGMVEGKAKLWWEDVEASIASLSGFYLDLPQGRQYFDTSTPELKLRVYEELMDYLFFEVSEIEQRAISAELSKTASWDDNRHILNEVATWNQLKSLASDPLCSFGAHTMCHYLSTKLDEPTLKEEIAQSRDILAAETGKQVDHLAFPYGFKRAAGPREFLIAEELGFKTAVTTRHGVIYKCHNEHQFALPRVSINGHFQSLRYLKALLSGIPTRMNNKGRRLNVS